jgi:predicted ATPase
MYYFDYFKGFAHAELDLSKPLTVLIGANGSGKSNLIEAIELLSFIAQGGKLHDITELGRGGQLEIRGGLQSCAQYGQNAFSLGVRTQEFAYSVKVQTKPVPQIVKEQLFFKQKRFFETLENHHNAKGEILVNYDKEGVEHKKYVSARQSVLSQYHKIVEIKQQNPFENLIQMAFRSPFIFEPNSKLMRQYEQIGNPKLAKNGANLSAVLYEWISENERIERLLNWIRQLPNEPYLGFDFDVTKYNSVMFGLKEGNEGNSIGANLLSDGTLRSLAILTLLELGLVDVGFNSLVIIEEFDNGLYPSRIKGLFKAIVDYCQAQPFNMLVTTHNPATLNALPSEQLDGVVLCTGDKLVKLDDLPRYPELLERGQLGELVTRRVIDQYLVPDFEEERQREAFQWLEKLP